VTVNDVPAGVIDVVNDANQDVVIDVRGPDVLNISGNVDTPKDPDAVMPDWIELIVAAANLGMMCGAARPAWSSRAAVTRKTFDPTASHMQWVVALEQVDAGVFLVILTVLDARQLDAVSLWTLNAPVDAPRIEVSALAYPGHDRNAPFEIRRETPLRTTRDRMLQIVFTAPPADEVRERIAAAFDVWGQLLILGGYSPIGRHPALVHTLPDFAYWSDEVTFVQPFEEFFESDETCFNAMISWASRLHHEGVAVRSMTIA
jgi:hypothetical protein